ncbi:MAG: phosphatidate cytidylyltransferase [Treponema sp.]|nr:phosphatidate cytidylyltransferase [Treponema sp.]
MSNLAKRLMTFIIGLPLMIVFVLVKPYYHVVLQIVAIAASILSINEYHNMVSNKIKFYPKWLLIGLNVLLTALSYFFLILNLSQEILLWVYTFIVVILMAVECFSAEEFSQSVEKIALAAFGIFYIGYLITFVNRMCAFENETHIIVLFFVFVFMCDSAAWFFGMLFGKNNRGFFKASPNKSIAGFIGGIATDIALACVLKLIFPSILEGTFWRYIILAFGTAVASIIGDLIESVIKRSCNTKDSGNVIPGRGGMLDCIDSIVIAAPVFYILYYFLLAGNF